jgi:hypothetical protein
VLRFEMSRSVITVQREFRTRFKKTNHARIMYFVYALYISGPTGLGITPTFSWKEPAKIP